MTLLAQIIGGPKDGERITAGGHGVLYMLEEPCPAFWHRPGEPLPAPKPMNRGIYTLCRGDDGELYYVRTGVAYS